jgi:hypothetical protein
MPPVAVEKCWNPEAISKTLPEPVEAITDSILQRAFDLFLNQNGGNGSALDDWLQTEQEVVSSPASELVDQDIQVSAMPNALIIQADTQADAAHRRLDLPASKGILVVTAQKTVTKQMTIGA